VWSGLTRPLYCKLSDGVRARKTFQAPLNLMSGCIVLCLLSTNPGWGALIGFAITLPYFARMASEIKGGQWVGDSFTYKSLTEMAACFVFRDRLLVP
jgi:hypothetical protein